MVKGDCEFGYFVSTDGVRISIHMKKPFTPPAVVLNDWNYDMNGQYYRVEIPEGACVMGVDPGRITYFTGAYGPTKDHIVTCKTKHWREISFATKHIAKVNGWTDREDGGHLREMLTVMPTACCYTSEAYCAHLSHFLHMCDDFIDFYAEMQ